MAYEGGVRFSTSEGKCNGYEFTTMEVGVDGMVKRHQVVESSIEIDER